MNPDNIGKGYMDILAELLHLLPVGVNRSAGAAKNRVETDLNHVTYIAAYLGKMLLLIFTRVENKLCATFIIQNHKKVLTRVIRAILMW
jgi:hypothetical protein